MSYYCSSCDSKAVYICTNYDCVNPLSCEKCSTNYFNHPNHSVDKAISISILYDLKNSAPSQNLIGYFKDIRTDCINMTQDIDRMIDKHQQDLQKYNKTSNVSPKIQSILERIKREDQSLTGQDMKTLINQINLRSKSNTKSNNCSDSNIDTLVVQCLKENFQHVMNRIKGAINGFVSSDNFSKQRAATFFDKAKPHMKNRVQQLALRQLKKSRDYDPHNAQCHFLIGFYQDEKSIPSAKQRAKRSYERCLTIEPYHVGALNNTGMYYLSKQQYQQAIQCYNRAGGSNKTVQYNLAECYFKIGNLQQAIVHLNKCKTNNNSSYNSQNNSFSSYQTKRYNESEHNSYHSYQNKKNTMIEQSNYMPYANHKKTTEITKPQTSSSYYKSNYSNSDY